MATRPYTTLMKAEQTGKREAGGWLVPSPESQRRSGDITGSRAAVEIYGWQIGDKPFSIKIPLDIVDRLQRDIQYGLGMTTSCDVMGLLIGRIATEYSSTLIIQDYVLTGYTSDSGSPELWSDERLAEMGRPFTKLASPFFVVGFFRSQRGEWPEVEKEDFKGAKRLLRSTPNVFLLIRTGFSRGFSGRLFLRPSKRAKFKDEYGEFPLNADILRAQCEATAPKPEQPPLHFVPGNPLHGRPGADLAPPTSVEASFARVPEQPAQPAAASEPPPTTLAELLRAKLFQPVPEQPPIAESSTAPKRSLWAKLFPPALEEGLRIDAAPVDSAVSVASDVPLEPPKHTPQQEDPRIEPAAAASAESLASPSLWAKPSRPAAEEKLPVVEPVTAASAESIAPPTLWAKPSRPAAEEKVPLIQPVAAASAESIAPPNRWARLFRPAAEEKLPVVEPVTAASAESIASPNRWARLFRPATEEKSPVVEPVAAASAESIATPSRWTKLFRPTAEEKSPVVEPIAAASAESIATPSRWTKLFRPTAEEKSPVVEPIAAASAESIATPSRWTKLFRPTAEKKSPVVEPIAAASAESIATPSRWTKLFRPTAEEKSPVVQPIAAASAESIATPSRWTKLFRPTAEEKSPVVEPIAAASAESIATPSRWTKLFRAATEEKSPVVQPIAAASAESIATPSRWTKLFRPTAEEKSPVVEPVAAASAESIAPDLSPEPPKPSLWAKAAAASADLSRPAAEEAPVEPVAAASAESIATPSRWTKLFRPATAKEEAPVVQPVAAASAESIASDISTESLKPSLWARARTSSGVAFATKTRLSTLPWNRWLSIAATWIIAVGGTMWFMHGRSSLRVQRPEVSETRTAILSNLIGLHVDNSGRLLNISWDRASSIAMNSKAGFLTIRDGSLLSEVRLDSTEVRTGHIYYRPRSEDLGIRLEVTGDDGGMASESVRVLGPLASNR